VLTYLKRRSKPGKKPKQKELILGFEARETAQDWAGLLLKYGEHWRRNASVEKPFPTEAGARVSDHLVAGCGSHLSETSQHCRQPDSPAVCSLVECTVAALNIEPRK
jgi:Tfp pilus assembly protein PilX